MRVTIYLNGQREPSYRIVHDPNGEDPFALVERALQRFNLTHEGWGLADTLLPDGSGNRVVTLPEGAVGGSSVQLELPSACVFLVRDNEAQCPAVRRPLGLSRTRVERVVGGYPLWW